MFLGNSSPRRVVRPVTGTPVEKHGSDKAIGEHSMAAPPFVPTRETPSQTSQTFGPGEPISELALRSSASRRPAFSRRIFEISDPECKEKQDGVLIVIGAVAVPGGRVQEPSRRAVDDVDPIAHITVLGKVLVDRQ